MIDEGIADLSKGRERGEVERGRDEGRTASGRLGTGSDHIQTVSARQDFVAMYLIRTGKS